MGDERQSGFTRPDLVRGAVSAARAAAVGDKVEAAAPAELGPGAVPVELEIGRKRHPLSLEPRVVLAV